MICIFCKKNSTHSKSIEHIVPESLGNKSHTLPPGVVCDSCNNYFARKVEKPILESGHFRSLRFHQAIANKSKRIPPQQGFISPGFPVHIIRSLDGTTSVAVPSEAFEKLLSSQTAELIFPIHGTPPNINLMSRFLAKIGLEAFAQKGLGAGLSTDYLAEEVQLDPVRNWARRGYPEKSWPFHQRQIYDSNCKKSDVDGHDVQTLFEYDFLITPTSEYYFCIAIFGTEYTINIGGPDLDGYLQWLEVNNNASPLYIAKERIISPLKDKGII